MNVPISRNNNILNGENLSPSETVVTDSDTNLTSVPYSSTSQPNSFVYRDASGNASVNGLKDRGIPFREVAHPTTKEEKGGAISFSGYCYGSTSLSLIFSLLPFPCPPQ